MNHLTEPSPCGTPSPGSPGSRLGGQSLRLGHSSPCAVSPAHAVRRTVLEAGFFPGVVHCRKMEIVEVTTGLRTNSEAKPWSLTGPGPPAPQNVRPQALRAALPQALEPLATAPTTCLSTPQAMASELQARKALLGEVQRNLQAAKQCSGSLASRFQEHCPDLERQEAEVQKLCQRFDSLCQQAELRSGAAGVGRHPSGIFAGSTEGCLFFK